MIKHKLNDEWITDSVKNSPVIRQSKSYLDKGVFINTVNAIVDNTDGDFSPQASGSIQEDNYITSNVYQIYDDNLQLWKGYLSGYDSKNIALINLNFVGVLGRFRNNRIYYETWNRGDGTTTFVVGQYSQATVNGYLSYWETPAYAAYHVLRLAGYADADIDMTSLSETNATYAAGSCYIQINATAPGMTPQLILNEISNKCFLYIFVRDNGKIAFQHDFDYSTNSETVVEKEFNRMDIIDSLDFINDWKIQIDGFSYEDDDGNNDAGQTYRTESGITQALELDSYGIIIFKNATAAAYIGDYAISDFHYKRLGIKIEFSISDTIYTLETGLKITSSARGWNEKLFEPFYFEYNLQKKKRILNCYEVI